MTDTGDPDVLVIGSGVAGALAAWRLSSRGLRVRVLEAGPRLGRADIVSGFKTTYRRDLSAGYPNPSWAPRPSWGEAEDYFDQPGPLRLQPEYLRVVGGTTWHWAGMALRLLPSDLALRSTYGVGTDWPIGYADLSAYYDEAEAQLGVSGNAEADVTPRSGPFPMPALPPSYAEAICRERFKSIGIELVPASSARNSQAFDGRPRCQGFSTCSPICPSGAQYGAIVHVEKAEALGARVVENARVDRLLVDRHGRIAGLEVGRPDGSVERQSARAYLLAANGLESPRLLLASAGDLRPAGLANTSAQVGRNFMDSPGMLGRFTTPYPLYGGRGPELQLRWVARQDGPERATRAAWAIAANNRIDLHATAAELIERGVRPPELDAQIRSLTGRRIVFVASVEQLPDRDNRLTLDWDRRDSAGQPRMVLTWSLSSYERAALDEAKEVFAAMGGALEAEEVEAGSVISHHHLMGTLRMGNAARSSVVDAVGRAHDHPNLFVAGSSVFPTSGVANPTLTIAALSLRTADAMAAQLAENG